MTDKYPRMILIIDDDSSIRLSLGLLLKRAGYVVKGVPGAEEALAALRNAMRSDNTDESIELMLMDMNYSSSTTGEDGLELLMKVKVLAPTIPVILMTAWGSIPLAVEGVKAGAMDFVTKPWDNRDLLSRIKTAISLSESKQEANTGDADTFEGIIGESEGLKKVLETVRKIAPTDAPVLITGENGTGKELIARAIHRLSPRAGKPFVSVNLGGLAQTLFESEMFGHARGAFTGADSDRPGRFEMADSGTIFLDEIGDLDSSCQVKMLRVLQEHTFERPGESTPRRVDIRVVCATNVNLAEAVKANRFREDLYYRINLITIHLPALRERREDIPLLVRHFAGSDINFTPDAMALLCSQPYPGNIRELRNLVKRILIVSGKDTITADDVRSSLIKNPEQKPESTPAQPSSAITLEELEKQAIERAIAQCEGNMSQVASMLGITRQSLYRRMEKFGIKV